MEQLLGLADKGLGWTLFVISALVNIYQYKLNRAEVEKRFQDWQTSLKVTNELAESGQELQKASSIMIQGIDTTLKIILDRMGGRKSD